MDEKLEKVKQILLKYNNPILLRMYNDTIKEEGLFDARIYCNGDVQSAFTLGGDISEAKLAEELLTILRE